MSHLLAKIYTFTTPDILESMNIPGLVEVGEATRHHGSRLFYSKALQDYWEYLYRISGVDMWCGRLMWKNYWLKISNVSMIRTWYSKKLEDLCYAPETRWNEA